MGRNNRIDMLTKIKQWWRWDGKHYHRDFVHGIKNLWKWFPIIWKDREWDDHYIWEILMFKLSKQAKYIGDRDFHTLAKRDAEIMMTCVKLMEKVKEEFYHIEYMDYHESDYNFIDSDIPGCKELKIVQKSEKFDEYFKKYPLVYKKVKKMYPDEPKDRIAYIMSTENHNRARRILFELMEKNIERWWE